MVTERDAREMTAAIKAYQVKDANAQKVQNNALLAAANGWFNSLPQIIKNPIIREQALANYREIESLLETVADPSKIAILRRELSNANETFKQIKKAE